MTRPECSRRMRRRWSGPAAAVAIAVLIALAAAVAGGLLPLHDAIALALALLGD
ncbi:hypothetical protein [Roseospira marina]|uniref:hypothetical protein n=1 Tax=Roseospira marina TaxID=140057 RepID=UPI00147880FD|nr:hypothetical protein [Roseospira marina]MBB4314317.1 hypothetical protein [Roseospira marina]MBB5087477.1 hypothetical protein [Roseospira marina]